MLVDRILRWASLQPEKTALVVNGSPMSYGDFGAAIESTIESLSRRRLPVSGIVLFQGAGRAETWVHILALRQLGLSPLVPLPWMSKAVFDVRQPDVVLAFTWRSFLKATVRYGFSRVRVRRARDIRKPPRRGRKPALSQGERPFGDMYVLSSGTTGHYKFIELPGSEVAETHEAISRTYQFSQDTVCNFRDLGPWMGLGGRALPSVWACGGTVIFDTTEDRLQNIFRHGTNITFIYPTLAAKISESDPPEGECRIVIGGGFLSEENSRRLERIPGCTAVFVFAATEVAGALLEKKLVAGGDDSEQWLAPVPGRDVEIVDEGGNLVGDGVEGLLRVKLKRGDSRGYLGDPDGTSRAFRNGCYYTGDLATRDGLGRIRISGRSSDVVLLGSTKYSAADVESQIRKALAIEAVCAFSGLGDHGEEQLAITLECSVSPPETALRELEKQLPRYESFRWICMPQFPRTDTGLNKVQRNALRRIVFPLRDVKV